ncbi:aspartate--tRNA(Asn) ligase [Oscillospiraceae bacterium MB08-C2-2]|nr:aspartate--tRNA(Asn) ligase [Oscillospiraceae bacterium MB08-C2-2]
MERILGTPPQAMDLAQLKGLGGENANNICISGIIYSIKDMGGFYFIQLRTGGFFIQCTLDKEQGIEPLRPESAVKLVGDKREDARAPHGFEIAIKSVGVLSCPKEELPFVITKRKLDISLEKQLKYRLAALRHRHSLAVFKLQEGLVRGFRDFLTSGGFTEIFSPKIVAGSAEGGANVFKMNYFGRTAFLAQSPQFYKQMMVPVYGRVFEIGPVFRAEKHDTVRHLNEYVSVDLEIGFIESFYDILQMETAMLRHCFAYLKEHCAGTLETLGLELPTVDEIPMLGFREAKELVSARYNRRIKDPFDLEPEEEKLIGQMVLEDTGSDFVFVTHYPEKKRPFYAKDDPADPRYTLSFDLLYKGMEITTGGQRIHDYDEQVEKMQRKGLDPAEFESFLMLHKYGAPPHGGMGMGLERLCMKLLGQDNIRHSSLFPRDTSRLEP